MTLRELSKRTGYSVSVLSRALNPNPDASCNISASTRLKIRRLVDDLGFRPNRLASCMRRSKVPSLGIFLPMYTGSLITDAVFGISRAAAERSLPLNFYFGEYRAYCMFLERMIGEGCTGIIAGSNMIRGNDSADIDLQKRYMDAGGKMVFFNEHPTSLPKGDREVQSYSVLSYDDYAGGKMAAAHLHSQHCRNLLFVTLGTSPCYLQRQAGFEEYCQKHKLSCRIIEGCDMDYYNRKSCPVFFPELLFFLKEHAKEVTGLFVPSDYMLLDIMVHLSTAGLQIGRQVLPVGYNFSDFTGCISGWTFATLQQDFVKEGHLAITMLEELMDGKNGKQVQLQPQLRLCNQPKEG
ncbi:MAG: LacI family DNA-binding transcriptional regulator [Lentisphaeria bacterium]